MAWQTCGNCMLIVAMSRATAVTEEIRRRALLAERITRRWGLQVEEKWKLVFTGKSRMAGHKRIVGFNDKDKGFCSAFE